MEGQGCVGEEMSNPDVERILELEAEIVYLKELLQPYLDAEEAERKRQAWQDRLEYLVNLCIPSYSPVTLDARKEPYPVRHPKTASWWNGASVTGSRVLSNGDICVEVKSYVGRNEYDDDEITLLKEWFDLKDPAPAIQEWCVKETARLTEARKEYVRREALAKIASLNKQLENL